jgi:hypothetical protein
VILAGWWSVVLGGAGFAGASAIVVVLCVFCGVLPSDLDEVRRRYGLVGLLQSFDLGYEWLVAAGVLEALDGNLQVDVCGVDP